MNSASIAQDRAKSRWMTTILSRYPSITEVYFQILENIYRCTHLDKICVRENNYIYEDIHTIPPYAFPRYGAEGVELKFLLLAYKTFCCKEDWETSGQAGGSVSALRKKGYVFSSKNIRGEVNDKFEYYQDGVRGRFISYWEQPEIVINPYIKISDKDRVVFMKDKHCVYTHYFKCLEIDHRMSREVCKIRGIEPYEFTKELMLSGKWKEHFQIIHRTVNDYKREACKMCYNGKQIPIYDSVACKFVYRQFWGDSCEGCFWYDPSKPLYPENFMKCPKCTIDCPNKICTNHR